MVTPTFSSVSTPGKKDKMFDNTLLSVASSLSKLVDSQTSSHQTELKFKEFHEELDKILRQLPFMTAMEFNLSVMRNASALLENEKAKNS